MKQFLLICVLISFAALKAQELGIPDSKYLEDQFYVGLTYNALLELPREVSQRSLSYGLQGGFIKDIPLNSKRTFAIGIGAGYALNSYYSNLRATASNGIATYDLTDEIEDFKRSKIETHSIEFPIEFRWRNSNPIDFKFWRIYPGIRFGYAFSTRSKFVTDKEKVSFSNDDLRAFQYGAMINLGYNTFNLHVYYGLNSLFEDNVSIVDGSSLSMKPLRLGLIFYIL